MALSPAMTALLAPFVVNERDIVIRDIAGEIADALGKRTKHTKRKHITAAMRALAIVEARSTWAPDGGLIFRRAKRS